MLRYNRSNDIRNTPLINISLPTVTFAYTLHPRANCTSTSLAIMFPHQLAGQSLRSIQNTFLHRFFSAIGPVSRKLFAKVYILRIIYFPEQLLYEKFYSKNIPTNHLRVKIYRQKTYKSESFLIKISEKENVS